jgi:uncharacterized membrane protein
MSPAATVPVFATALSAAPAVPAAPAMPAGMAGTATTALDDTDAAELAAAADVVIGVDETSAIAIIKNRPGLEHLFLS